MARVRFCVTQVRTQHRVETTSGTLIVSQEKLLFVIVKGRI